MNKDQFEDQLRSKQAEIDKLKAELAEEKTKNACRFHQDLLSNLPGMIFFNKLEEKWKIEFVSEGCVYLTGFKPEELIGDREDAIDMLTVEEDRQKVREEIEKAVGSNNTYYIEYRILTKSGQIKYVSEKGRGIYDSKGKLTGIGGFLTDISRHKLKEIEIENNRKQLQGLIFNRSKELAESEEKHRILVENLKDGVFILQGTKVVFASTAFKEIAGYEKDDIVGRDFWEFTTPESAKQMMDMNRKRLNGEKVPSIYETVFLTKSGNEIAAELNVGLFQYQGETATIGVIRDISERKMMEDALVHSEQRLSFAMDAMNDGLWDWNVETNEMYFNSRYYSMLGFNREEIGDPHFWFRNHVHPEDFAAVSKKLNKLVEGEVEQYLNEFRIKNSEGEWIWVMSRAKVFNRNKKGKVLRIVGTHTDITERKNALEQVKTNLALLESFIDTIPSPVFYKNIAGQYIHCNKEFSDMMKKSKLEIIGKSTFDMLPSSAAKIHLEKDDVLLKTKKTQKYEIDHNIDGDEIRSYLTYKNLFFDENEMPAGIIGVLIDITARKKIENDLRENQKFLSSILEKLPVILWCIDKDGKFTFSQGLGLKKLGLEADEVIGQSVFDIYANSEVTQSNIRRALAGENFQSTVLFNDQAYETFYIPLRDVNNNVEGVLGVSADITQRHQAQEEVRRYIEDVQESRDQIERSAFELAKINYQLEQSEQKLKELNASKDRFFSIISHDLKSPFTSILGLSEIAVEEISVHLSKEDEEVLKALNKSANNVYNLLENLLEWSRLQLERIEFEPTSVELFGVVKTAMELFREKAGQKKIKLTTDINPTLKVFADENMIETIVRNLVSNALKFTGEQGEIKVLAEHKNDIVEMIVEDNGIGMSQADVERLFKIDEHHTTTGLSGETGTGLGLILCKELSEKNNGSIRVESSPGYGSRFIVSLPIYM